MDDAGSIEQRSIFDFEHHRLPTAPAGGDNASILFEHGRNAQRIPDAITPPGMLS